MPSHGGVGTSRICWEVEVNLWGCRLRIRGSGICKACRGHCQTNLNRPLRRVPVRGAQAAS